MDPLSITAAIVGIGAVATSTSRAFKELRDLCKTLPGRLHALSNEVSDIQLVIHRLASLIEERASDRALKDQETSLQHLLNQAGSKLSELKTIVETLTAVIKTAKIPVFRAHAWRKNQPRLQALQEDIKTIKCSLNIMLGASNSQDMMRIRVDLQEISAVSSSSVRNQANMEENLHNSLARHRHDLAESLTHIYQKVDQRIGNVEELLQAQTAQLQISQFNQLRTSYGRQPSYSRSTRVSRQPTQHEVKSSEDIGMKVTRYAMCVRGCSCRCHTQTRSSTPGLVDRILGQMFIGYAGLPLMSGKCDTESCEKNQAAHISVEYWFPLGFLWSKILRLQLTYQPMIGPQFELSTHRRVPDSAQCVNFALTGNIDGLKNLFRRGLASPRDVSSTRGYSVLRWAMYGKQFQTCKFLLHSGADPDYRPVAASDNSPRNKAHQALLMGRLSEADVEALRCLTQDDDFIEEQNYTKLHRIILGLSMANLEEEILFHPETINARDVMNRTPLAWAACRGDDRAIVILLSHGAEVNTLDIQHSAPVCHAADRNHLTCIRLLLEAGADPNIAATHGYKVGDALNVAARNAFDPLILKTLLDFGANIESCGVDGMTPLIHASRRDNASFAFLLLEYGANINAVNSAGQTPLTTAVAYNSHKVLRLLLNRWFEYSECPRLTGPHLLQIVALHADLETIIILMSTDHLRLKYDSSYALGDFVTRLNERPDATEKLVSTFDELLSIVRQEPKLPGHHGAASIMEAGLAYSDTSESDSEVFENALESLHLGNDFCG
jgi:ankyrin repeat protein